MLMKLIVAPVLAFMMALSGCQNGGGGIDVASVQAALKNACGFELVGSAVAQQIAALSGIPGLTTAVAIADAICAQVNANMAAGHPRVAGQTEAVVVRGVPLTGRHIR